MAFLLAVSGCTDETSVFQIVDCGLLRQDLTGTWCVGFDPPGPAALGNCTGFDSGVTSFTVDAGPFEFNDMQVFTSDVNVGIRFEDTAAPNDLFGNVEADSCLMLLSFLDDEGIYLNCFGTFDIPTGTMLGGCDSAAVLDLPLADPPVVLEDCDLIPSPGVTLTISSCP